MVVESAIPGFASLPVDEVIEIVEADYALGNVVAVEQLHGGCTHLSFAVTTWQGGRTHRHFFRKYRRCATARAVDFEHALIRHLIAHGAQRVAGAVPARDGRSHVHRGAPGGPGAGQRFFAVFDFVGGEDKYSWTDNQLSDEECRDAAALLAELHHAAKGFGCERCRRSETSIIRALPQFRGVLESCAGQGAGRDFDDCFQDSLEFLLSLAERTAGTVGALGELPCIGIHGDFHPGNLKYSADRVTGVFDFDRASIDLRLYDLALAIIYFCAAWGEPDDGRLRLDRAAVFLHSYQERAARLGAPGRLTAAEVRHFPELLAAASLALLKWVTADSYYAESADCDERLHLSFLRHILRLNLWVDSHRQDLAALARRVR